MIQTESELAGLGGRLLRPTFWVVLLLMLLALATRVGFLLAVAHPEARHGEFAFPDASDESDYHRMARNLAVDGVYKLGEDGPPTAKRPPGMVLPMAALYALLGPSPWWALAWVMACSLATIPVVGWLTRGLGGGPVGVTLAMLIAALMPTSVFTAAGLWSEPPALLLTLLALALLADARPFDPGAWLPQGRAWALAGLALGLAYLVRPAVQAVIVLLVPLLAWAAWQRRSLGPWLLFVLLAILPIVGWGWRNAQVFGEPFHGNTESTAALWGANNPVTAGLKPPALERHGGYDLHAEAASGAYLGSWVPVAYLEPTVPPGLGELERHHWYQKQVRGFVVENPGAFVRLVGYKLWRTLTAEPYAPSILGESPAKRRLKWAVAFAERWFLLLAGGCGLWLLFVRRETSLPILLAFLAGSAAVVVLAYVNARIFLPVSGLLIAPAALAVAAGLRRIAPPPRTPTPIEADR